MRLRQWDDERVESEDDGSRGGEKFFIFLPVMCCARYGDVEKKTGSKSSDLKQYHVWL